MNIDDEYKILQYLFMIISPFFLRKLSLQDQVLAITNIIMDELLGEDRATRTFRAKFPEEVLQESLAGQLWFGAECLAAGSSIMNRETESALMRPLAKAVTKSLDHIRNLLREQCLRNKTPNSLTLNLDLNDAETETLCESLKIFDRLFAEFELLYVSAMVQVKSKQEHEMQELICVLFSETLQRALRIGLLDQEQVDYYDPALMFSIPRLAIVAGLVIFNKGPLNMSMPADDLSEMFRPFRTLLFKIRDLLRTLNANELHQLEKLLCTNEDIHIYASNDTEPIKSCNVKHGISSTAITNFNCDDTDDEEKFDESNSSTSCTSSGSTTSTVSRSSSNSSQSNSTLEIPSGSESDLDKHFSTHRPNSISRTIIDGNELTPNHRNNVWSNLPFPSAAISEASSTTLLESSNVEHDSPTTHLNKNEWISTECASGYLIPNTNFGNLLQTTDTPLTDSFISSDDEYTQKNITEIENDGQLYMLGSTSMDTMDSEADMAAIQSMMDNVRVCDTSESSAIQNINTIPGVDNDLNHINVIKRSGNFGDSGIGTSENTSLDQTPDSEMNKLVGASTTNEETIASIAQSRTQHQIERSFGIFENDRNLSPNASEVYNSNTLYQNLATPTYYQSQEFSEEYEDISMKLPSKIQNSKLQRAQRHSSQSQLNRLERYERKSSSNHSAGSKSSSGTSRRRSSRQQFARNTGEKVSISSTSCIYSGREPEESVCSGRMKFK